jgi:hypothetical protein
VLAQTRPPPATYKNAQKHTTAQHTQSPAHAHHGSTVGASNTPLLRQIRLSDRLVFSSPPNNPAFLSISYAASGPRQPPYTHRSSPTHDGSAPRGLNSTPKPPSSTTAGLDPRPSRLICTGVTTVQSALEVPNG